MTLPEGLWWFVDVARAPKPIWGRMMPRAMQAPGLLGRQSIGASHMAFLSSATPVVCEREVLQTWNLPVD